jgi:catechol 2,3-dioxygenase-like lactoylglutathione lyase family enzyme
MLGQKEAVATLAVKDLAVARKFYQDVLGLKLLASNEPEALTFGSGSTKVLVYRSQYAGTNKATALNWMVGGDIEKVAQGLKAQGVAFEHYDLPGMTRQGDVHVAGDLKAAWFRDPDGNILCVMNR